MRHLHKWIARQQEMLKIALAILALGLGGCALGVTPVEVAHSPFSGEVTAREGTILVKQFTDNRPSERRQHIGNKRNLFGAVLGNIGTQEGVSLQNLITRYFVEALQHAGYKAVQQPASPSESNLAFDAVLEGEIKEFWLDLYVMTWHNVDVMLTLKNQTGTQTLWERDIQGDKKNVLWLGVSAEFEKVIQEALDIALDKAIKEFTANEFQDAVKKSMNSAATGGPAAPPTPR